MVGAIEAVVGGRVCVAWGVPRLKSGASQRQILKSLKKLPGNFLRYSYGSGRGNSERSEGRGNHRSPH